MLPARARRESPHTHTLCASHTRAPSGREIHGEGGVPVEVSDGAVKVVMASQTINGGFKTEC
jgi:hypothetical protein